MNYLDFISKHGIGFNVKTSKIEPLPLFDFQKKILKQIDERQFSIFVKSRQMFFTTMITAYVAWYAISKYDKNIVVVFNDNDSAKDFLNRVKIILQSYYGEKFKENTKLKTSNFISLTNGSRIQAICPTENAGKGEYIDFLVLDEFSFLKNAEMIWTSLFPTIMQNTGKCIMYSSVRYTEDTFYKIYENAIFGESNFIASKILWHTNPIYNDSFYEDMKKRIPNNYKQELDCEPINKPIKKKDTAITFRIDDWMEHQINKKLVQKSAELNEHYSMSTYLRELIMKDLAN